MNREYRRLWVRSYIRKNNKRCKKRYSRVRSHWIKIPLNKNTKEI